MTRLAILADDLTGAADAGGTFASTGLVTAIVFGNERGEDADVVVRSTDSRGMDAADAAEANRRGVRGLLSDPPPTRPRWVYKKIDSALRGHPCEELIAVMAGLGEHRALVAPALPAEGRTTVCSQQLIDGIPAAETAWASPDQAADLIARFGCDERMAVRALDLVTVRSGAENVGRFINNTELGIVIADAETDEDLSAIVRGALDSGIRVMAGSAGMARQLAIALPGVEARGDTTRRTCATAPMLVVAASRHGATATQVTALGEAGVPVVRPSQEVLDGVASAEVVVSELVSHLGRGQSVVLTTAGLAPSKLGPAFVAEQIGDIVVGLANRQRIGGLVLTGGDIAAVVLARLETNSIILGGEVRPAMPWGMLHSRLLPEVPVVTKAGSFGERDALLACLQQLGG